MPVAREQVTLRNFLDGELTDDHVVERNVHRPREGRAFIRVLGARTYLTQDEPPVVERHARTVENRGTLRARVAPAVREAATDGRPVRVIGLF